MLSRVTSIPVKQVWPHEARHFTQWLLQNSDVLGALLGMDLQLTAAEHRVGNFALDLIGTDLLTGQTVIVENQLEGTDHSHLGQLLTYAGGTDPSTVVWCAPEFRDEHRAALDWLNEHTEEGIRFFGVKISAIRIDGSAPAPRFRLVAEPNDWTKQVHETLPRDLSDRELAYQELWVAVLDRIHRDHPSWTNARAAPRDSWITPPFGSSVAWYSMVASGPTPRVELYFGSSDAEENDAEFNRYLARREQLEQVYGAPLDFQPLPGRKACRIAAYAPEPVDVLDERQRMDLAAWFVDTMVPFRDATQRVKAELAQP